MTTVAGPGGENSSQARSISAPRVCCTRLASAVVRCTRCNRSTGSAWSVPSTVKKLETRLPRSRGARSAGSVETGTAQVRVRAGSASRWSR